MNLQLSHAREVLGEATDVLVGNGSTRDRLLLASKILLGIAPGDFRDFPDLQLQFDAIHAQLTKVQDPQYGSYDATVRAMSGPAMGKLTQAILDLDRNVRAKP